PALLSGSLRRGACQCSDATLSASRHGLRPQSRSGTAWFFDRLSPVRLGAPKRRAPRRKGVLTARSINHALKCWGKALCRESRRGCRREAAVAIDKNAEAFAEGIEERMGVSDRHLRCLA